MATKCSTRPRFRASTRNRPANAPITDMTALESQWNIPAFFCVDSVKGEGVMSNAADRLSLCEAVLVLIEQKRAETDDECLGMAIERVVLDMQFRELEADIMENPGAFEPWLIRRRR